MKIVKYLAICVISCLSTFILSADEPIKLIGKTTYYQENELQYRIRIVEILGKKFIIVEKSEKVFYKDKNATVSVAISITPYGDNK